MVTGLILLIIVVVFLAFFIGKNLDFACALWPFESLGELPVSLIVLISFAAGVVFSLILVIFIKLNSSGKKKEKSEETKTKKKRKEKNPKTIVESKEPKLPETPEEK